MPWQSYMIPQFILMSKLQACRTRCWSIIALQAFGAFGVFLMKQFYETIPEELSEAARIDGLSEYGIYRRIMLPLSMPALASLTLLTFVNHLERLPRPADLPAQPRPVDDPARPAHVHLASTTPNTR